MLRTPFNELTAGEIHTGNEYNKVVSCKYVMKKTAHFTISDFEDVIRSASQEALLNAGICGGETGIVISFLERLTELHKQHSQNITTSLDMPIYNYTILKYFENYFSGETVNTRFKKEEINETSWWKHK
jgi:hypothetical protein